MPASSAPKELPTLRDSRDPQQVDVFQREVREIIRRLQQSLKDLEDRVTALE